MRKRLFLPILILALLILSTRSSTLQTHAQACTDVPAGIVSWWPADGDAADIVGSNHGVNQGGVSFGTGVVGQAFRFGGSLDSYISVPDHPSLDLTGEVTVEFWFNRDIGVVPGWQGLVVKSDVVFPYKTNYAINFLDVPVNPQYGIGILYNDPDYAYFGDDKNIFETIRVPIPPEGVFHHFAGTMRQVDAGQIELSVYVNGTWQETQTLPGSLSNTLNDSPVTFGSAGGENWFVGLIDEVSLYNRALSASEITAIYEAGSAGKCTEIRNILSLEIDVPSELTVNDDGWYEQNPTQLRVNLTNNRAETFSGDLEITFSDSSRLVFGEGDEFLEHPNRLTHHIDSLAAGASLSQVWKLWVQPMSEEMIVFTGNAINSAGESLGEGSATMSIPTASIHPVVVIPGWPGSFKNFDGDWEIDPIKGTYNNLLEELQLAGYEKDVSLFTFPYDWRQDANKNADELSQKIPEFLAQTAAAGKDYVNASKVDLVGHSGGGLVSRAYIQGDSYGSNVHRLITLGTPHQGTPKAYLAAEGLEFDFLDDIGVGGPILAKVIIHALAWKNGYCTSIPLITEVKCIPFDFNVSSFVEKEAPSIRQVFPTDSYLSDDPGGYLVSADDPDYEYPFGHQVNGFLNSLNDDIVILIDRLGVNNVIAVVGDRHQNQLPLEDTDKLFRVMDRSLIDRLFGLWSNGKVKKDEEFRPKGRGDKTVPQDSANLGIVDGQVQTKVKISSDNDSIIEHGRMPTQLQQSIVEYLTKTHPFFDAGFIDPEIDWKNALIVGNLSPVEIQVTDPLGRRSGLDFLTGNEFTEIPGAFFSRSDLPNEPDFIFIPDALDGEYRINLKGINEGNYRVIIQALGERDILTLAEFSGSTSAIQEHEHLVLYDAETVPETPLTLEWLPPLKNPDETLHVSKERILPIKFTIKDARGDFVADESIIVWIVDPDELSEAKAAFTSLSPGYHGKSDVLRINVQEKLYIVNLHLYDYDFIPGRTYVVGVTAFGEQLGITGVSVKDD